ncbi:MAG TPA: hypothetical protein VEI83_09915 [Acidimicrobiales bacterium]|nr:hypothetical protein [Acidimicrobiales bacterium]
MSIFSILCSREWVITDETLPARRRGIGLLRQLAGAAPPRLRPPGRGLPGGRR